MQRGHRIDRHVQVAPKRRHGFRCARPIRSRRKISGHWHHCRRVFRDATPAAALRAASSMGRTRSGHGVGLGDQMVNGLGGSVGCARTAPLPVVCFARRIVSPRTILHCGRPTTAVRAATSPPQGRVPRHGVVINRAAGAGDEPTHCVRRASTSCVTNTAVGACSVSDRRVGRPAARHAADAVEINAPPEDASPRDHGPPHSR